MKSAKREAEIAATLPVWMHENELAQLTALIEAIAPARVLEWGSGGSTRHCLANGPYIRRYVSVEHQAAWADKVRAVVTDPRLHLTHVAPDRPMPPGEHSKKAIEAWDNRAEVEPALLASYVRFPSTLGERFDFVLVDGRARCFCIPAGWALLEPGGVLVLHDAQRPEYHAALNALGRAIFLPGWQQGQVAFVRKPVP